MKSISGLLIGGLAVGLALSALFGAKSLPIWLFVIALLVFGGSKKKN
jgi:hypothetical protein